jgi:hypothetical protein
VRELLEECPRGRTYTLPRDVRVVYGAAFVGCTVGVEEVDRLSRRSVIRLTMLS